MKVNIRRDMANLKYLGHVIRKVETEFGCVQTLIDNDGDCIENAPMLMQPKDYTYASIADAKRFLRGEKMTYVPDDAKYLGASYWFRFGLINFNKKILLQYIYFHETHVARVDGTAMFSCGGAEGVDRIDYHYFGKYTLNGEIMSPEQAKDAFEKLDACKGQIEKSLIVVCDDLMFLIDNFEYFTNLYLLYTYHERN